MTLLIQSRTTRNGKESADGPLITKYRSKIGNESLIFNPSISVTMRGYNQNTRGEINAWIPVNVFYRFTASLSYVYQQLSSDKLYYMSEDKTMFVDQKIASTKARKVSLFRNSLTMIPCIFVTRSGTAMKGIDFQVDGSSIGAMAHTEILNVLDQFEHFDIMTFSLLAGVVDEMESMNGKLELILGKLDGIESLIQTMNDLSNQASKRNSSMLSWKSADVASF